MRTRYRSSFLIGSDPEALKPDLQDIARECVSWVFDRPSPLPIPGKLKDDPLSHIDHAEIAESTWIETQPVEEDENFYWGIRFVHPDATDPGLRWLTDLCVSRSADTGAIRFTCVNKLGDIEGIVRPTYRPPSRPRIVPHILDRFGGRTPFPLLTRPQVLPAEEVPFLLKFLKNSDRRRPVVLITARNETDRPIVNAPEIAYWLAGIAHVYVARDRFPSFKLLESIPRELSCWDGAIRIYWPGFRVSDRPFQHRLWGPFRVQQIESQTGRGMKEMLLRRISEIAVYSSPEDAVEWEDLQAARRRNYLSQLKRAGELSEYVELADEELASQRKSIENLTKENEQLSKRLAEAKEGEESWKEAYLLSTRGEKEDEETVKEEVVLPVRSLKEVVERAIDHCSDRVAFPLNSKSEVDRDLFEDKEEVWAVIEWLSTVYFDSKTGIQSCPDLDLDLRASCGWRYRAHQNEATMSKYQDWYQARWNGKVYQLPEHVGTGSGKDPRHTMRIAFVWDANEKKVVIGYIGQHQQTDAT